MFGIDFTFLWTAVNLAIIYFFVNKYLFGRLGVFMENRSAAIVADIKNGEELKAKGEAYFKQYEDKIAEANKEYKRIIDEARLKASKEYDSIVKEARKESTRIIKEAHEENERERIRLHKDIQYEVAALVVSTASKVIESNMDNERNNELIDQLLSEGAA